MQRQRRNGYSLMEAVIAILITSIGLVTTLTTMSELGRKQVTDESVVNAAMMAQAVMERAIVKGYTNVSTLAGTGLTYDATNFPGYTYDLNVVYVNVTDLDTSVGGPTNYRRVEVKVYHTMGGAARLRAQLRTILNKNA